MTDQQAERIADLLERILTLMEQAVDVLRAALAADDRHRAAQGEGT